MRNIAIFIIALMIGFSIGSSYYIDNFVGVHDKLLNEVFKCMDNK